ncbi:MAG: hypothetical protein ACLGHC_09120 [Alphaproteobacteria bacterium]
MADFPKVLIETEHFLMAQLGSRGARARTGRQIRRGVGEVVRRLRRAGLIFLLLLFALILFSAAVSPLGWAWLLALPATFVAALLSLMWPTRGARPAPSPAQPAEKLAAMPLPELAGRCEHWLIDRTADLPHAALGSADTIVSRLRALQPAIAELPATAPVAGEVRRLIGDHLPRLVDSYLALPPEARDRSSENSRRVSESLDIVADELTRLCNDIDGTRSARFETEHRFIETRYRDGGPSD